MSDSYIRTRSDGIWEIIWKDEKTGRDRCRTTKTRDKIAAEEEHARFVLANRVSGGRPTVPGMLEHYYAHVKDKKGHSTWYNMQFNIRTLRDRLGERWSRNFGPVVKVDRMMKETIQNEEKKEPFAGV
jgi:hypothetical protein